MQLQQNKKKEIEVPKGNKSEVIKLNNVSLIKCICVFLYIPQKHAI